MSTCKALRNAVSHLPLLLVLSVSGCHPGGDDSGDPAGYVGAWSYGDATTTSTCPASDVTTGLSYPGGTLDITQSGSGLTAVDRDGCSATFTISGSTATAQSGQSCTTSNGDTVAITSWTIFVYDPQTLWNERTTSRTSSAGSSCTVSVVATVHQ